MSFTTQLVAAGKQSSNSRASFHAAPAWFAVVCVFDMIAAIGLAVAS